jgi:hypothetical protein
MPARALFGASSLRCSTPALTGFDSSSLEVDYSMPALAVFDASSCGVRCQLLRCCIRTSVACGDACSTYASVRCVVCACHRYRQELAVARSWASFCAVPRARQLQTTGNADHVVAVKICSYATRDPMHTSKSHRHGASLGLHVLRCRARAPAYAVARALASFETSSHVNQIVLVACDAVRILVRVAGDGGVRLQAVFDASYLRCSMPATCGVRCQLLRCSMPATCGVRCQLLRCSMPALAVRYACVIVIGKWLFLVHVGPPGGPSGGPSKGPSGGSTRGSPGGGSPEAPQRSWDDSGSILGRFWVDSGSISL